MNTSIDNTSFSASEWAELSLSKHDTDNYEIEERERLHQTYAPMHDGRTGMCNYEFDSEHKIIDPIQYEEFSPERVLELFDDDYLYYYTFEFLKFRVNSYEKRSTYNVGEDHHVRVTYISSDTFFFSIHEDGGGEMYYFKIPVYQDGERWTLEKDDKKHLIV